jgi:hypothetical protein
VRCWNEGVADDFTRLLNSSHSLAPRESSAGTPPVAHFPHNFA